MKNKGFTLVELLAVIAILAILVIVALPNVMGMFNEAKKNSFTTEVKQIYKVAQQQWISDSMFETKEQTYTRCKTCSGKSLDLSGRSELEYLITISKSGNILEYYATDGTYQFRYSAGNLIITDIVDVEQISELDTNNIIRIENNACIDNNPKTFKIGTTTYEFTVGMTWQEWINSSYNTSGIEYVEGEGVSVEKGLCYYCNSLLTICNYHEVMYNGVAVQLNDTIIKNGNYTVNYSDGMC